ncbi:unnamed protein product [Hymenolepis diminuta]|uniref:C2H2-type domain-containing protein n=1 Tax=Hymenolepis diminuta TaxID=6216 RepID=A0A0R3SIP0_HYMDI|nr:unnamed protein product [Hymenolepis diminuta]
MSILESLLLSEQYGIPSTSGCYTKPEPIDTAEGHGIPSSRGYIKPRPSDRDPKSFECDICGKSFNQARYMKAHVEAVHENLKPFKCEICERCYSDRAYLENHVRFVHASKCIFCTPIFSLYYVTLIF